MPTSLGADNGERLASRKCSLGKGTRFVVISFRSTFRAPSKRTELVRWSSMLAAMPFMPSKAFPFDWPATTTVNKH